MFCILAWYIVNRTGSLKFADFRSGVMLLCRVLLSSAIPILVTLIIDLCEMFGIFLNFYLAKYMVSFVQGIK